MKKNVNGKSQLTCADINMRDMVDYLASIGHLPKQTRHPNYWFLSPLRDEKTPSFKVDRKLNKWFDFGTNQGGSLVDFCLQYHRCSVAELLAVFSDTLTNVPPLQPVEQEERETNISNFKLGKLSSKPLISYLSSRRIDLDIAQRYLKEASYDVGQKHYYALAFVNLNGGGELRNKFFKGSYSPKGISYFDNGATRMAVFEGFFDFLTYLTISKPLQVPPADFLILNSVGFVEEVKPFLAKHTETLLFLDNDKAGDKATATIMSWGVTIWDHRERYKMHKDLNSWLCDFGNVTTPELSDKPENGPAKG